MKIAGGNLQELEGLGDFGSRGEVLERGGGGDVRSLGLAGITRASRGLEVANLGDDGVRAHAELSTRLLEGTLPGPRVELRRGRGGGGEDG